MKSVFQTHTLESVKAIALQYETRAAFQKGSNGAYKWALRNGHLDEVCAHMKPATKAAATKAANRKARKAPATA